MAQVLQITDGTTTVNLISGALKWALEGWQTQSANAGTWEVIQLVSDDTDANIRSAIIDMEKLFEKARMYAEDDNEGVPVVLKWASEGEASKQTVIRDGRVNLLTSNRVSPLLGGIGTRLSVTVLRDYAYESTSATTVTASGISSLGGTLVIGNDTGTLPQRIGKMKLNTTTIYSTEKIWAGIRRTRNGVAGFVPKWEAETITLLGAGGIAGVGGYSGTVIADATASGGTTVAIHYGAIGTASVDDIGYVSWDGSDTGTNRDDIVGRYLVLGRMRANATSATALFQLKHLMGGTTSAFGYEPELAGELLFDGATMGTVYHFQELGVVQIPPGGNRGTIVTAADEILSYQMHLYSQRLSSAGTIYVDCFTLIPAEHLFTAKNLYLPLTNGTAALEAYTFIDGTQRAYQRDARVGDTPSALMSITADFDSGAYPWEYPVGGGVLVIATDGTALQDGTATIGVSMDLYPRWASYQSGTA